MRTKANIALTATGLLLLAACGSSSKSPSTQSGGGSAAAGSTAKGAPIKIGMLNPENAQFYNAPDELGAVKAAIATINASGGVKGRPLQLDWCNEANDPNKAAACARGFVSGDDVATVDSITVTAGDTVSGILTAGGIANVNYGALTDKEFNAPNTFPYDGAAAWENAGVVGAAIKSQGVKKVVIVRNDNPQTPPIENLVKIAAEHTGGSLVGHVLLPVTAIADYSTYAQQIIATHADLADIPLGKAQAIGIINAARQLGSTMKFAINSGAFSDADLKQLGGNADGLLVFSATPWIHDAADYPGINAFLTSMKEEVARGDKDADVANGRPYQLKDWATVFALRDVLVGLADSGTPITKASVMTAFSKATDLSMQDVTAEKWSPSKKQTVFPAYSNVANTFGYLLKVQNGQQLLAQKEPVDVLSYLK